MIHLYYVNEAGQACYCPSLSDVKSGYCKISEACFSAFFINQEHGNSNLMIKKLKGYDETNGIFALQILSGDAPVWSTEYAHNSGYLPARPNAAYTWNGTKWVVDAALDAEIKAQELAALKADLCAQIDARAIEVGDSTVKSSVYLSSEYQRNANDAQAWKDAGYAGKPPLSVKAGAESHGITAKEEADLILRESAIAEGFIETLRTWRMNAKGVMGIQGALTIDAAQTVFDAAMLALDTALSKGK